MIPHLCRLIFEAKRATAKRAPSFSGVANSLVVSFPTAGEVPLPMFAAYGASKAALCVFSKTMRLELANWGVQVVLIQPSGFKTSTFNRQRTRGFKSLRILQNLFTKDLTTSECIITFFPPLY